MCTKQTTQQFPRERNREQRTVCLNASITVLILLNKNILLGAGGMVHWLRAVVLVRHPNLISSICIGS